jgi:hypothetical protein
MFFDIKKISPHCFQFPRVTKELNGLKNRAAGAAKNMKKASSGDDDIDDCYFIED